MLACVCGLANKVLLGLAPHKGFKPVPPYGLHMNAQYALLIARCSCQSPGHVGASDFGLPPRRTLTLHSRGHCLEHQRSANPKFSVIGNIAEPPCKKPQALNRKPMFRLAGCSYCSLGKASLPWHGFCWSAKLSWMAAARHQHHDLEEYIMVVANSDAHATCSRNSRRV